MRRAVPLEPERVDKNMQLSIKGKQVDIGDALRTHIEETLPPAVAKYFDRATDAQVVVSREGTLFKVDIQVHVSRPVLVQGQGQSQDPYGAYEEALEHDGKRLRRNKRRLTNHHPREDGVAVPALYRVVEAEEQTVEADEAEGGDAPIIVAEMPHEIETLSAGEAVMRMDLGDLPALLFRNAAHGRLNMVYRRKDGNVGWVDPQVAG